ncbi:DUF5691 domain-containing protein [Mucilaginibacter sp. SMC90]|uniref:DUF5691 domain-containing protein n=1 Tax=Mucilaginibacter sp. SMC90 TaxID=2929803 RepID=UPI001FB3051C|nr:DUF5691 domain-containing protein [Mucilaginibacter sp. SMC90]UOE47086.1 DUF5691 domain-containing protein [Mucilaginibacter sp. SMC90]
MRAWESIINTAMLGTDKPTPAIADLPEEVAVIANAIDALATLDKEERYLQKATVIYNYRQSGFVPFQKNDLPDNKAAEETKPYCSAEAAGVLNTILDEESDQLLQLWLNQCSKAGYLLLPEALPAVLEKAQKDVSLRNIVIDCGGNRGVWLSKMNPVWNWFTTVPDEELWQTGTPAQRTEILKRLRLNESAEALKWLQQTWEQENAAGKLELLKAMKVNSNPDDLPWLEGLLNEKGQKIKDEALALLKSIPGSSVIKQYEELLQQSVSLKKEKALLGLTTKTSIQLKLPPVVDESIYKSGIEKLSGPKSTVTDENYVIYQLISSVPPAFWEKRFEATPVQVVEYFEKYAPAMVPALANAVAKFGQKNWVPFFLGQSMFYPDFVEMLSGREQEKYLLKALSNDPQNTIAHAIRINAEWGTEFAIAALLKMANWPYEYNRGFFTRYIGLIPVGALNHIENITSQQVNLQPTWDKTRNHLINLLSLKQQTLKAFNA